tara:strand:- start:190 stop:429 length:240 start_codon:yes stop_codon:yes gene_type:complete
LLLFILPLIIIESQTKNERKKLKMSRYIEPSKYRIVIHSDNLEEIELFENLMTQGLNTIAPHRNFKGITIANNFQGYWS